MKKRFIASLFAMFAISGCGGDDNGRIWSGYYANNYRYPPRVRNVPPPADQYPAYGAYYVNPYKNYYYGSSAYPRTYFTYYGTGVYPTSLYSYWGCRYGYTTYYRAYNCSFPSVYYLYGSAANYVDLALADWHRGDISTASGYLDQALSALPANDPNAEDLKETRAALTSGGSSSEVRDSLIATLGQLTSKMTPR